MNVLVGNVVSNRHKYYSTITIIYNTSVLVSWISYVLIIIFFHIISVYMLMIMMCILVIRCAHTCG